MSYLNKALGLETVSAFPSTHAFARTSWDPSYFDIPYGTKPDEIERRACVAIGNTPTIFAHFNNPTPRMQRALLAVVEERLRRNDRSAGDLVLMLTEAYASPHIQEALPGLRAEIADARYDEASTRVHRVLSFLANMRAPFDVIDGGIESRIRS
jgi:hypothetical protein